MLTISEQCLIVYLVGVFFVVLVFIGLPTDDLFIADEWFADVSVVENKTLFPYYSLFSLFSLF